MSIYMPSCPWVLARARWVSCLAVFLAATTSGYANVNPNGVSLNLSTTDLSSGSTQINGAGARLLSAGTPAFGIVSADGAGAKIIIEPMHALAANGNNGAPVADFIADPLAGGAPLEVHFSDLSSEGLYEILSWTWDFGDSSPYSSDPNPVHTYDVPGVYTVSLTILTTGGTAHIVRDDYVTVVQAVPSTGRETLLLMASLFVLTGIILIRNKRVTY